VAVGAIKLKLKSSHGFRHFSDMRASKAYL
jgi:hypothetical protein